VSKHFHAFYDGDSCEHCHCTRLDSGHHDRGDEECPVLLRDELQAAEAERDRALALLDRWESFHNHPEPHTYTFNAIMEDADALRDEVAL